MSSKEPYLQWQKSSYEALFLVPICIIVGSTYFVTILLTIIRLVSWKKEWKAIAKLKEADRKVIAYMLETFFNMLHHREAIQSLNPPTVSKEPGEELKDKSLSTDQSSSTSTEKTRSTELSTPYVEYEIVHSTSPGHVITTEHILSSKWAMTLLSWYVASVASLALVVFWDQFIVEQITASIYESKNSDCYILDTDGRYTLVNISDDEPIAVDICYSLSLDFPKAIAEVAGILFLSSNGFAFLTFLMLLVVDGIETPLHRLVSCAALAAMEYGAIGFLLYSFGVHYLLRGEEDSINLFIEEFLMGFTLVMGATTPWLLLRWASKRWVRKRDRAINSYVQLKASNRIGSDSHESTAL